MAIAGVMLLDDQQRSCAVQLAQTAQHAFVFEARRLSPLLFPQAESPSFRLSGPDSMPINSVLRLGVTLVADQSVDGDLECTLLGISLAPTIDAITLTATIRLRGDASAASRLRIDFNPVIRRPIEISWTGDWSIERWLRELRRAATRCPLMHPPFAE